MTALLVLARTQVPRFARDDKKLRRQGNLIQDDKALGSDDEAQANSTTGGSSPSVTSLLRLLPL
jgi:hypothetical protein